MIIFCRFAPDALELYASLASEETEDFNSVIEMKKAMAKAAVAHSSDLEDEQIPANLESKYTRSIVK